MSSKIAKNLLSVLISDTNISDIIWRNASLDEVEEVYNYPSIKVALEYMQILQGEKLLKFASLIGPTSTIDNILNIKLDIEALKGLIANPAITEKQLNKIEIINPNLSDAVKSRIAEKNNLKVKIANHDYSYINDHEIILSLKEEELLKLLDHPIIVERNNMIKTIFINDKVLAEKVILAIFGAIDDDYFGYIDTFIADYLVSNRDKENIATNIDVLDKKKNSRRISNGALAKFYNIGYNFYQNKNYSNTDLNKTSKGMLETLLLAGEAPQTISTLVLSTNVDLTEDEFCRIMVKSPISLLSNFVKGQTGRKPQRNEISSLFQALSLDSKNKIAEEIGDFKNIEGLPWANEVGFSLPKAFLNNNDISFAVEVHEFLNKELGSNYNAWEFFLVVSEEWEDDFHTLVNTAKNV